MFIRKLQREIAVVAIAACSPLVFGCATTNRYVVDPDLSSPVVIDAFVIRGDRATVDADPGAIDPAAKTITGIDVNGKPVTVSLDSVERLFVRDQTRDHDAIDAMPDALIAGALWRPDGQFQYVALHTGEVVDVRKTPTALDAGRRALLCTPAAGPASVIPFDEILYVQVRDTHPGRTALCIIGLVSLASFVAMAIAISQDDFRVFGDGEW